MKEEEGITVPSFSESANSFQGSRTFADRTEFEGHCSNSASMKRIPVSLPQRNPQKNAETPPRSLFEPAIDSGRRASHFYFRIMCVIDFYRVKL